MIPGKLLEILEHEGVVAIATTGEKGPHLVNTWNSYITINEAQKLLIPVGGMHRTEANLALRPELLLTLGCREVDGFRGPGTGYLIEGTGVLQTSGPDFEAMKARFHWMRAVLVVNPEAITQTL